MRPSPQVKRFLIFVVFGSPAGSLPIALFFILAGNGVPSSIILAILYSYVIGIIPSILAWAIYLKISKASNENNGKYKDFKNGAASGFIAVALPLAILFILEFFFQATKDSIAVFLAVPMTIFGAISGGLCAILEKRLTSRSRSLTS